MTRTLAFAALSALIAMPAVAGSLFPSLDLPTPPPFYKAGEFVEIKINGERGMVIAIDCGHGASECRYLIRLPKCGNAEWMTYPLEFTTWIEVD